MKKTNSSEKNAAAEKKGYNEKNPDQPEGAFPPASANESKKEKTKSNTADKKAKEDQD